MRLRDAFRDRKSEAQTAPIGAPRLPKPIEQSCALFLRNAWPGISHGHTQLVGIDESPNTHPTTIWGELQRIADQVVDQLQHSLLVGLNNGVRRFGAQNQRDSLLGGAWLKGFHCFRQHASDVAWADVE